jgi:hypothetical protein
MMVTTSARQGVRAATSGRTTLCHTTGMAPALIDRLEHFSNQPTEPVSSDGGRVSWSHVRIHVNGKAWSVLSRIESTPPPDGGPASCFFHHLIPTAGERTGAGPAAVLATPGQTLGSWNDEPRVLAGGRRILAAVADDPGFPAWKAAAGDAGWAGALAATAADGRGRPAVVITPPSVDPLALARESLSLLPASRRWEVTFSTADQTITPDVECQWRFLAESSQQAKIARSLPGAVVIDLTRPLPQLASSGLVEQARSGRPVVVPAMIDPSAATRPGTGGKSNVSDAGAASPAGRSRGASKSQRADSGGKEEEPNASQGGEIPPRRSLWEEGAAVMLFGAVVVVVLAVGGGYVAFRVFKPWPAPVVPIAVRGAPAPLPAGPPPPAPAGQAMPGLAGENLPPGPPPPEPADGPVGIAPDGPAEGRPPEPQDAAIPRIAEAMSLPPGPDQAEGRNPPAGPGPAGPGAAPAVPIDDPPAAPPVVGEGERAVAPLPDEPPRAPVRKTFTVELPELDAPAPVDNGPVNGFDLVELAGVDLGGEPEVRLECGAQGEWGSLALDRRKDAPPEAAIWDVSLVDPAGTAPQPIASFWFLDGHLHFAWQTGDRPAADRLRRTVLKIAANGNQARVGLWQPKRVRPLAIDLGQSTTRTVWEDRLTRESNLALEFHWVGPPVEFEASQSRIVPESAVALGKPAAWEIGSADLSMIRVLLTVRPAADVDSRFEAVLAPKFKWRTKTGEEPWNERPFSEKRLKELYLDVSRQAAREQPGRGGLGASAPDPTAAGSEEGKNVTPAERLRQEFANLTFLVNTVFPALKGEPEVQFRVVARVGEGEDEDRFVLAFCGEEAE